MKEVEYEEIPSSAVVGRLMAPFISAIACHVGLEYRPGFVCVTPDPDSEELTTFIEEYSVHNPRFAIDGRFQTLRFGTILRGPHSVKCVQVISSGQIKAGNKKLYWIDKRNLADLM